MSNVILLGHAGRQRVGVGGYDRGLKFRRVLDFFEKLVETVCLTRSYRFSYWLVDCSLENSTFYKRWLRSRDYDITYQITIVSSLRTQTYFGCHVGETRLLPLAT